MMLEKPAMFNAALADMLGEFNCWRGDRKAAQLLLERTRRSRLRSISTIVDGAPLSVTLDHSTMEIHPSASWALARHVCPCCGQGGPLFSSCPSCGVVVLIRGEVGTV